MKTKILSGIMVLGLALISTAQITVNRYDIGNLKGAIVIQANDTLNLNLLSPGNAGANQTWNLTGLFNDCQDTLQFLNPIGLNCSEDFPTATLGLKDSGNVIFGYDDNTLLSIMGVCTVLKPPDTTSVAYSPAQKRMTFPTAYNTAFSGQSKARIQFPNTPSPPDSVRMIITVNYTSIIDGWGTVSTPTGTYAALRQKYTTYEVDSMFAHMPVVGWISVGSPTYDTTIEYSWWSQKNPFIASITTDNSGHVQKANYLLFSNLGFNESNIIKPTYSVFPNPSDGKFTITAVGCSFYSLEIINLTGETVYVRDFNNGQYSTIADLSALPKGLYIVKISDGKKIDLQKIIIQ